MGPLAPWAVITTDGRRLDCLATGEAHAVSQALYLLGGAIARAWRRGDW